MKNYLEFKYALLAWFNAIKKYHVQVKAKRGYNALKRKSNACLSNITNHNFNIKKEDIYLFAIMRNESFRLAYFIEYYKKYGIGRLFLIDNNSTDDSIKIASQYAYVEIFKNTDTYVNHWYWMEHLLEKYGKGHWCVVVDIDELLYFPHAEKLSLPAFRDFLEQAGSTALRALLLDMYSDKAVKEAVYTAGHNPLDTIPYFDKQHYEVTFPYFDRYKWTHFTSTHFTGGMRERIFGKSNPITSLNKVPFFKFLPGTYLGQGMHAINGAKVSDLQGVVFHTKFLSDSILEAQEESVREQHFNNAAYYKDFKRHFDADPDLCLATPDSIRFQNSVQLVELGLMKTTEEFEEYVRSQTDNSISKAV